MRELARRLRGLPAELRSYRRVFREALRGRAVGFSRALAPFLIGASWTSPACLLPCVTTWRAPA